MAVRPISSIGERTEERGDGKLRGDRRVVKAHHRDVTADGEAMGPQHAHSPDCREVVNGEHGRGMRLPAGQDGFGCFASAGRVESDHTTASSGISPPRDRHRSTNPAVRSTAVLAYGSPATTATFLWPLLHRWSAASRPPRTSSQVAEG